MYLLELVPKSGHLFVVCGLRLKLSDFGFILFDYLLDHLPSNATIQALPIHQAVILHFTHLNLGRLLDLHSFLAEFETAHGLLYLAVRRSDTHYDGRLGVAP